ncbi:MAG: PD40 domain-containing protein, partial [Acidobacteria bacterium]|nr:PD40 domain-containing protein [Acidobacteriota bacterium]
MTKTIIALFVTTAAATVLIAQNPPAQQQTDTVTTRIAGGDPNLPPKYAVPDFIAPGGDAKIQAIAKLLGEVLWDDLNFEREFYLIPRDTYKTIPAAAALDQVPLPRWKELGTDGLVVGSIRAEGANLVVQVRLLDVNSGVAAFSREYKGASTNPRFFAHSIADDIHKQQVNLRGVAKTKLAFTSTRDAERMSGPNARDTQNIYIGDYDGANQRRISVARTLELGPTWSPDAQSIAYTSYLSGYPDIIVADIYKGRNSRPAKGTDRIHNFLSVWSPDGQKLA